VDVTDVLRDRLEPPAGLQRMITFSLLAHGVFAAALVFAPGALFNKRPAEPRIVMNISLEGSSGPASGGRTAESGRATQTVVPKDELKKPDSYLPPAAVKPEMVISNKTVQKPSKAPPVDFKEAPDQARGRTPTRGTEITRGQALTYTGARGEGFGLSTGGGAGTGSFLDVADFCCPDYIAIMIDRIRGAWQQPPGSSGTVTVKFTIQRDGRLTDPLIEKRSTSSVADNAALRAVLLTKTLNPLPTQYPNPTLGVHLNFEYR
jgi:TonB family protein